MKALSNTKENQILIDILKTIKQTYWVGNSVYSDLESCVTAINLETQMNSGFYIPSVVRLKGVIGNFLVNEDGSLLYDYRVIKTEEGYLKETLTTTGFNYIESEFSRLLQLK